MPLDLQQVPARKCGFALDKRENVCYSTYCSAGVAHLVERHLAKVEVASSSLVARSIKHHNEGCGAFLFLPKAREGSADGAARGKGGILFRKREYPLFIPQRKAYIAGLALEELHALRNRLRCRWLRHESSASRYRQQPRPTPWGACDGSSAADCGAGGGIAALAAGKFRW